MANKTKNYVQFKDIPEEYRWHFKEFVKEMVKIDPSNIEYATDNIASDENIALLAMKTVNLSKEEKEIKEKAVLNMVVEEDCYNKIYVKARIKLDPDYLNAVSDIWGSINEAQSL